MSFHHHFLCNTFPRVKQHVASVQPSVFTWIMLTCELFTAVSVHPLLFLWGVNTGVLSHWNSQYKMFFCVSVMQQWLSVNTRLYFYSLILCGLNLPLYLVCFYYLHSKQFQTADVLFPQMSDVYTVITHGSISQRKVRTNTNIILI